MKKTILLALCFCIPFMMNAQKIEDQKILIDASEVLEINTKSILIQKKDSFEFIALQQQKNYLVVTLVTPKLNLPSLKKPNRLDRTRVDYNFQKTYKSVFGKNIRVSY